MGARSPRRLRRVVTVVVGAALATGGLVALAGPAAATGFVTTAPTSTASTDSATPHASHLDPATLPVGTTVTSPGHRHTSKAYYTFDLSHLAGHQILFAQYLVPETAVADCSVATTPQSWLTASATRPTFADPPHEQSELSGPGQVSGCPDNFNLTWDATQAIRTALAAGRQIATIEVRLSAADQTNPAHELTLSPNAELRVQANLLPTAPTSLTIDGKACGATPLLEAINGRMTLGATVSDTDDGLVGSEFDWWPVAHPDQRTTISGAPLASGTVAKATVLDSDLADATTYAWQARGVDVNQAGLEQDVNGPFSPVCEFTTDFTRPATAPIITSAEYPSGVFAGGVGVPGTFTISAGGDTDVTAFLISPEALDTIPADHPGGSITVPVTPTSSGPARITVTSVDAAGNRGASSTYQYLVAFNGPTVTCTPATVFLGQPIDCTFTDSDAITGYSYTFGDAPAVSVPADADGTGHVTITPTDPDQAGPLAVRARLANGNLSEQGFATLDIETGTPTIDQSADEVPSGSPVTFTFHSMLPGSVSFTYTLGDTAPVTIPVGPDGTATVTIEPKSSDAGELQVFSTTAAGVRSSTGFTFLDVDSNAPTVSSDVYPESAFGGGVGDPGTFTFSSPVADVVSYTYSFNGADPVTVAADADGTASVLLTPEVANTFLPLVVTSTFADGSTSDSAEYDFLASTSAPIVACSGTVGGGQIQPGDVTCTFTPVQENVTSYSYTINGGAPLDVTSGPGGTATVDITAVVGQSLVFHVRSRNAEGGTSDDQAAVFDVVSAQAPAHPQRLAHVS
jgi:hypothetical protein